MVGLCHSMAELNELRSEALSCRKELSLSKLGKGLSSGCTLCRDRLADMQPGWRIPMQEKCPFLMHPCFCLARWWTV